MIPVEKLKFSNRRAKVKHHFPRQLLIPLSGTCSSELKQHLAEFTADFRSTLLHQSTCSEVKCTCRCSMSKTLQRCQSYYDRMFPHSSSSSFSSSSFAGLLFTPVFEEASPTHHNTNTTHLRGLSSYRTTALIFNVPGRSNEFPLVY